MKGLKDIYSKIKKIKNKSKVKKKVKKKPGRPKKKVSTKKVKKKVVKKKLKRGRPRKTVKKIVKKKIINKKTGKRKYVKKKHKIMDEIYKILNKVQLGKKPVDFTVSVVDSLSVENVIKDLELKYNKNVLKTQVSFVVFPRENEEIEMCEFDYLDDELPEDGQIFG